MIPATESSNPLDNLDVSQQLHRVTVSDSAARKVRESVRDLLVGYPFLGSLASSDAVAYHAIANAPFPLAATDGVGIYLSADPQGFFDDAALSDANRQFLLAHEILHRVLESVYWKAIHRMQGYVPVPRSPTYPEGKAPFDNDAWERTEDARINDALVRDNVGKPYPGFYSNPGVRWEMEFGEAYAIILPPPKPPNQPQQGQGPGQGQGQQPPQQGQGPGQPQPGQGPGAPGQGQPSSQPYAHKDVLAPGQGGDAFSDDPGASQPTPTGEALEKLGQGRGEREVQVQRARNAARQAGAGSSCVEELVIASRQPGVDWRNYIPGFLSRCAGNSAFDFTKPARAPLLRPYLGLEAYFAPARSGHGCETVVFAGDVSGSIREAEHRAMLAHVAEMLDVLKPREFLILWCDDRIVRVDRDVDTDTDFSKYVVPKGGGTSFKPVFEWLERERIKPDGLVYFTDFYGEAPATAPDYPVLWLCSTDLKKPWRGAEFGEVLNIPMHELT